MLKTSILCCTLAVLGLASTHELKVQPDKDNVVASRLEGSWVADPELNTRLKDGKARPESWTFTSDPSVAGRVPAQYAEFFADKQVYMSGITRFDDKEQPFILVEHSGNPCLVAFRERDGDPMGDAESAIVMLARAKDRTNDILFVGGDFNNEPLRAYQRAERAERTASEDK